MHFWKGHYMNFFMQKAIEEAESGIHQRHGGPFGCVVVKNGEIIGKGHNEVLKQNDPTCHGEMLAIRDACRNIGSYDLSGCELYTTAEPCPMCLGAIMWANIGRVFYGCNISDTDAIGFRDEKFYNTDKTAMLTETDRRECLELFDEYRNIADKTIY